MEKNIFIFWDGPQPPAIIRVLQKIMDIWSNEGKNYNLKLYNATSIKEDIYVPENISQFNWANQTDYYRTHLVAKYGGIWLDSDMIVMDDLSSLFNLIEQNGAFFVQEDRVHLSSGCFGAKAGNPAVVAWARKTKKIVESGTAEDWGSLGPLALTDVYKEGLIPNKQVLFGPYSIYPIIPGLIERIFSLPWHTELIVRRPWQPVITLTHPLIQSIDKELTPFDVIRQPTVYGHLIRESIEKAAKVYNKPYVDEKYWDI
jgi:hypothetical protein